MQWIENITSAVKVRTFLILFLIFIVGNLALYYLIIQPRKRLAYTLNQKVNEMSETYLQLRSTDMSGILKILNLEVEYLKQKQENILAKPLSDEQIPLLITKLQKAADIIGLNVTSSLENEKRNKSEPLNIVSLILNYTGTFQQVREYLDELKTWDEVLLIKEFHIQKYSITDSELSGRLKCFSIISSN